MWLFSTMEKMPSPDQEVHELLPAGRIFRVGSYLCIYLGGICFLIKMLKQDTSLFFSGTELFYGFAFLTQQFYQTVILEITGVMTSLLSEGLITVEPCLS